MSATEVLDPFIPHRCYQPHNQRNCHIERGYRPSQATNVDKAVAAGGGLGPIAGVPVGIKDTTDTAESDNLRILLICRQCAEKRRYNGVAVKKGGRCHYW